MRETLFLIPRDVFGVPLFGVGLLFYLCAACAVIYSLWTTWRRQWNPENVWALMVLAMMGAAIVFVVPQIMEKDGLAIRGYGVMVMVGVVAGVALAAHRAGRIGVDPELIYSLAFWMFLAGMIGARLFYIGQKRDQFHSLVQVLDFTKGGLVVYGSVIGGLAAGLTFAWRRKLPVLALADLIAPSMLLGLAIGRIGCLLNGCCFGGLCEPTWPLGLTFPQKSPPYATQFAHGQFHGVRLGADERGRPVVVSVLPNTPASASGIKPGERLESIQLPSDRALEVAQLSESLRGRKIELVVRRGELEQTITLTLGPAASKPDDARNDLGFSYAVGAGSTLTVIRIAPSSSAAKAGLRRGDSIVAVRLPQVRTLEETYAVLAGMLGEVTIEGSGSRRFTLKLPKAPARSLPIHPTQIYSSLGATALFLFLWSYYPYRRHDGEVFAWMITLYPIGRFLIEIIRDDEAGVFGTPLTISQTLSLAVFAGAILFWIHLLIRRPAIAWKAAAS